jgi:hypothetical protein
MRQLLGFLFFLFFFTLPTFSQQHFETRILKNVSDGKITQWETIEIGLRLPVQERLFRAFLLDHSHGINPYAQNNLHLQFSCNGKTYSAQAFYYEDAIPDENSNHYVTKESEWPWRVRFAVPDTGLWQCTILSGDYLPMAVPQFSGISFQCVPGKNHGYIGIASDKKHFQFSDGTPFFALGENICWSDQDILRGDNQTYLHSSSYYDWFNYINNLADNGGNYVRIVMIQWSTGIMWQEKDVYSQAHAFALDSVLHIAEKRGLHIQLCFDLCTGFIKDDTKENQNPIRRAFQKEGTTCADLLRDTNALAAFDQYIRYVYARWAFSPAVASIEVIGEENRWDGFYDHPDYFSDFYSHVDNLLRNELNDHNHLLSTSCTNPDHPSIYKNDVFSFIDMHHYDNNFNCNKRRFNVIHSSAVEKMNKPFLWGEIGMTGGPINACDAGDQENCSDVSMHNAMWSTFFMGGAGIGNYWWNWANNKYREANFPALRFFLDSIIGNSVYPNYYEWDGNGLECFYQLNENKKAMAGFGWVHNESSWWGNISSDCKDRNGKQMIHPKDDDKATTVENRAGNKFVIKGMRSNHEYGIVYYDTRTPGKIIATQKIKSNRQGKLNLIFPTNCVDCAFKIFSVFHF